MFFNRYPYTDFHELNLDWILAEIKYLHKDWTEFKALNAISFGGEWSIANQYPAWTIVSTNNGQEGFISIQPVPAGIDINNTDYWVSIVNYTGVINDIKKRLDRLENKKVLFISDSYGVGWNPDEGDTRGYIDRMIEYMGLTEGESAFVSVHSGYGFYNANGKFITLLENASVPDPESITDILVGGGVNDAFDNASDLDDAIAEFMTKAEELYPNAMVSVAMIGGSRNAAIHAALPFSVEHYQNADKYPNGRYVKNSEYIMVDKTLLSSDGTHPLDAGYAEIAHYLANFYKNGGIDIVRSRMQLDTSSRTTLVMFWSQYNDKIFVECNMSLTDLPYNAIYGTQWQTLVGITNMPFGANGEMFASASCVVAHTVGGNTQYDFYPMDLRMTDAYIEFQVKTGASVTIQNVTTLSFRSGVLCLPAMQF